MLVVENLALQIPCIGVSQHTRFSPDLIKI
nr:MAG TPA: hypothetical protein [Caudoviricetes sp.]